MSKKEKVIVPSTLPSPLNNPMTNYAVYHMSFIETVMYFILILIIGGAVGLVFFGGLFKNADGEATSATMISNLVVFLGVGFVAVKLFMPALRESLKQKRNKKLTKQFMDLLETLSTSLSSGNTLSDAFINAKKDLAGQYTSSDMIVIELDEILSGINNFKSIEIMLEDFGNRSCNEDIKNFSNVISNCYRLGGNFKDVVRHTRDIISDKRAVADEIDTKLSSNRMQLNAMCFMPVLLVGMLKVTNESFANNLSSFLGVIVTCISIGIFVGAYYWGRKIIDIK